MQQGQCNQGMLARGLVPKKGTGSELSRLSNSRNRPGDVPVPFFFSVRELVMPIRIECLDKPRDRAQPTEDTGVSAPLADDPEARYADQANYC